MDLFMLHSVALKAFLVWKQPLTSSHLFTSFLQAASTFASICGTLTYNGQVYTLYTNYRSLLYISLSLSEENHASCWAVHVTKTFGLEATISAYFLKQQMNNDQIREDVGGGRRD